MTFVSEYQIYPLPLGAGIHLWPCEPLVDTSPQGLGVNLVFTSKGHGITLLSYISGKTALLIGPEEVNTTWYSPPRHFAGEYHICR